MLCLRQSVCWSTVTPAPWVRMSKTHHLLPGRRGGRRGKEQTPPCSPRSSCPSCLPADVCSGQAGSYGANPAAGQAGQGRESPHHRGRDPLLCCRRAPGSSVGPQPPGSGDREANLSPSLTASCSGALERPCWFSPSGRAPKGTKSQLKGCQLVYSAPGHRNSLWSVSEARNQGK